MGWCSKIGRSRHTPHTTGAGARRTHVHCDESVNGASARVAPMLHTQRLRNPLQQVECSHSRLKRSKVCRYSQPQVRVCVCLSVCLSVCISVWVSLSRPLDLSTSRPLDLCLSLCKGCNKREIEGRVSHPLRCRLQRWSALPVQATPVSPVGRRQQREAHPQR